MLLGGAAGVVALLAALRPLMRKAQSALIGELSTNQNPVQTALGIMRIVALFVCPSSLRYTGPWLTSILSRKNPLSAGQMWMPYPALTYLENRLTGYEQAFEYGGGGSTLWLAKRVATLITVEHEAGWIATIDGELRNAGLKNCTLLLREPEVSDESSGDSQAFRSARVEGSFESYVKAIDSVPDASLDLVIVDGRSRAACLLRAMPKVRHGGLLVLDDSYRTRYAAAMGTLSGCQRIDFCGIRPFSLSPSRTTLWIRPK